MTNPNGRFGIHGGQYIPETLMNAVIELEEAYNYYKNNPEFNRELTELFNEYAGRPSRLYYAEKMTKDLGGAKIYLKREDLNHTGAHKINNVLGQALLAKKMGKTRLIAETGAGQHGVATATAAALMGILSNVSFTIPYKKKTAIVGKTGSGKSTTMSLLSGLLTGTEGSLFVGGERITESNRGTLLKSVSSIPSTTYLVNDTLRNNLRLGEVNSGVLAQVIESFGMDKLAMNLPNGYDTVIGPTGVQLSGGQQKLVGLARGLSVNRNFFLLDEVTTGLDDHAVEKVMSYLLEMDQTLVLITHNLKYIDRMDHIILFDDGRVVASGTYLSVSSF